MPGCFFLASSALPYKLPDQFFWVRIANMSWLALEGVTNAHRNRQVHVLVRQIICRLFSPRAVLKRLKVVENRVWVRFLSAFLDFFLSFLCRCIPIFLSHGIPLLLMPLFEPLSPCIILLSFYRVPVGKTTAASMPPAAVILEDCSLFRSIAVNRGAQYPPLATMPAQGVMYMYAQLLARFFQASLLLVVKHAPCRKTFSHTLSVAFQPSRLGNQ